MPSTFPGLILASTSPYRKDLLSRLGLPFQILPSNADEAAMDGETSANLAQRLANAKAQGVWTLHPGSVVIGSDQVADMDGQRLGKPGTVERAVEQLQACSGKTVNFYTAVT
ncbi:MAG: Maf family protein, partial [Gammaproteobacteria bacterium]|nr:Maf family protein [Gammaproteobacteria bacterium]